MSEKSRKIRRHLRRTLDKSRLRVKLTPHPDYPNGSVLIAEVRGWGAWEWAHSDQSIASNRWETPPDLPGYAYSVISNHPDLVTELRYEGYVIDLKDYPNP